MDKELKLNDKDYEDIRIGDEFFFKKRVDKNTIANFIKLTGDMNPLHTDDSYASTTEFGGIIVHGMALGSLFSTLIGMMCPGKKALYLSQDLKFKNHFAPGGEVTVKGKVISKSDVMKLIEIETLIEDDNGRTLVDGIAKAKVI